jgi:cysteinyl-tRNA synthetase
MELSLYDTLTREKRPFTPLDPARVRMYVCGPTVYDFAHIGNARPVIVFDVLFRLLRHLYGADHVVYVRNITDVDGVAKEVQPNMAAVDCCAQVGAQSGQRGHDEEAETCAQGENFHHPQRDAEDSHRDRHGRERQQRASHPEDDAN